MKYLLLLAFSIGTSAFLQAQFATFEAKTLYSEIEEYEMEKLKQMTWDFAGKTYRYGDAPISVPVNPNKVDTLLYQEALDQPWVSIMYKIREAKDYVFSYNTCCGKFNVRYKGSDKRWSKRLNFRAIGQKSSDKLLARHTAAGALVTIGNEVKIEAACHSAMSNNIYPFSLVKYTECKEEQQKEEDCEHVNCLVSGDDYKYDFYARTEEVLVSGLYMPLGDWDITITHDLETGKTKVD